MLIPWGSCYRWFIFLSSEVCEMNGKFLLNIFHYPTFAWKALYQIRQLVYYNFLFRNISLFSTPTLCSSPEIFLSTFSWYRISFRESLQLTYNIDEKYYLVLKRLEHLSQCSYLLGLRRERHVLEKFHILYIWNGSNLYQ